MNATITHDARRLREFNRFYTNRIGVLRRRLLDSPFSLAAARVLYEVANRREPTAQDLARDLDMDAGYVSRTVADLERRGMVRRRRSEMDRRQRLLSLTARGRQAFASLDRDSQAQAEAILAELDQATRPDVVSALATVRSALGDLTATGQVRLRRQRPGDIGWVIERHGALYAREYGWSSRFESLCAEILAAFLARDDAERERGWIADAGGRRLGSVFVTRKSAAVAQLRLLLVEPAARGCGLGTRLVKACIRFARSAGYQRMSLWTNDVLVGARRIYERRGFELAHRETHSTFGTPMVGETWELAL